MPTIMENIKQEENTRNTIDDELIAWVLDVDRRMVLTESMKKTHNSEGIFHRSGNEQVCAEHQSCA